MEIKIKLDRKMTILLMRVQRHAKWNSRAQMVSNAEVRVMIWQQQNRPFIKRTHGGR